MGFLRAQILSHLGERREVGEQHSDLHHAPFFDMGATAGADVRIARTASDSEGAVNCAERPGQHGAADAALCRQSRARMDMHGSTTNLGSAALSTRLLRVPFTGIMRQLSGGQSQWPIITMMKTI